jgi:lipopolysaccharide/colanic/teichoic acid biosynthesis glycosyltransferase
MAPEPLRFFEIRPEINVLCSAIRTIDAKGAHPASAESAEVHAEWACRFKLRSDPRIIPGVGRFLRRTSLEELPQLWSVLKGELSLAGLRPFPFTT